MPGLRTIVALGMNYAPEGDPLAVGRDFFFRKNDGEKLLGPARATTVVLFLLLAFTVYGISRRLFGPDAALLSFLLVSFSPTLRAHGRLVTTDQQDRRTFGRKRPRGRLPDAPRGSGDDAGTGAQAEFHGPWIVTRRALEVALGAVPGRRP